MAQFKSKLAYDYDGTIETGAVVAWRALRHALPNTKFIVLKRPVADVLASFARLGIQSEALTAEMHERAALLDQMSAQQGVCTISFDDLSDPASCGSIFEYCLEEPLEFDWWERLAGRNIQIDMKARLEKLERNRSMIEALKRDAVASLPEISIELEPFASFWPEADALFAVHFEEVDGGVEPNRTYRLDVPLMEKLCAIGAHQIITARVRGKLVGYCGWNVSPDVECAGLIIATQGPWFVLPEHDHLHLGMKMFDASIPILRALGVKNIFPHHRMQGRGRRLGLFFQRRGAKKIQEVYSLWIGG